MDEKVEANIEENKNQSELILEELLLKELLIHTQTPKIVL